MSDYRGDFDVVVIGGGPAGLSAGLIAAYKGLRTAVFEGGSWGGLLSTIYPFKHVFNYPGVNKILASHLVSEWVRQTAEQGAHLIRERVTKITPKKDVVTTEGSYYAKVIIIATGMRPSLLGIPGEDKFSRKDRGVYPYITEPEFFRDKRVLVIGGGDTALDAVIDANRVTDQIWLAHRKDAFRAAETSVKRVIEEEMAEILYNTELLEISGETEVSEVKLLDNKTGEKRNMDIDRVVIAIGLVPNSEVFADLGLKMDGKFIVTDKEMRTNIEGVFAAGDIISVYQLATVAAAQGALAAHNSYKYIRKPYWV
ncbi:MAG: NAD(P)/FAD-dependent oxidoreductase [Candidatus Thorarchaeota archaeon]|jgi:thioredoxin reductase (NADPH)